MLRRMAVYSLFYAFRIKRENIRYMESIGDRLRRQEKAKWEIP